MKLENILKKILLEISDAEAIGADVEAQGLTQGIESNLSKYMTVSKDDDFFTLGRLSIKPFGVEFNIIKTEGDDENLELPKVLKVRGLARVENSVKVDCDKPISSRIGKECFGLEGNGNLILRVKVDDGKFLSLMFNSEDIVREYSQTEKSGGGGKVTLLGLFQKKDYKVYISGDLQSVISDNPNTDDPKDGKDPKDPKDPNDSDTNSDGGGSYTPPSQLTEKNTRETQIAYLTTLFSKEGKDLWSLMGVNEWTKIPSGFGDRVIKNDTQWVGGYYEILFKGNSFSRNMKPKDKDKWVNKILKDKETLGLIQWVRQTRKGKEMFQSKIASNMPTIGIGDYVKKEKTEPLNQSVSNRYNLLMEDVKSFTKFLHQDTMDPSKFLKNLTNFMESLSVMYKLDFDRGETFKLCKKHGCPNYSSTKGNEDEPMKDKVAESVKMVMSKILKEETKPSKTLASIHIKQLNVKVKDNVKTGESGGGASSGDGKGGTLLGSVINFDGLWEKLKSGSLKGKIRFAEPHTFSDPKFTIEQKYADVVFIKANGTKDDIIAKIPQDGTKYLHIMFNSGTNPLTSEMVTVHAGTDQNNIDFKEDWKVRLEEILFYN